MTSNKNRDSKDYWAADRTRMANQRTLLSYIKTSFMLIVSGISLIKFFPFGDILHILGIILLPSSVICLAIGIYLYKQMDKRIKELPDDEELTN